MENGKKQTVSIDNLFFDKLNPRLPKRLQNITDEIKVLDYMIRYGNIDELMESIAVNGYSDAEPLLVVAKGDDCGYTVVEGNRRLAAVKLLSHPEYAKVRIKTIGDIAENAINIPTEIPVIIYSTREIVLDYLGYRHITGVKEWGALEKARYLDQLFLNHKDEPGNVYSKLAKMIGSRPTYVLRLHQALKLYDLANENAYYGEDIEEGEISFSWIYTALSQNNIRTFLNIEDDKSAYFTNLNEENYKKLFVWLFGHKNKVTDSRQISKLAEIVATPEAINMFDKGASIDDAYIYTDGPGEAFRQLLFNSKNSLSQALNVLPQINAIPEECKDAIENIKKTVKLIDSGMHEEHILDEKDKSISDKDIMRIMDYLKNKMGESDGN